MPWIGSAQPRPERLTGTFALQKPPSFSIRGYLRPLEVKFFLCFRGELVSAQFEHYPLRNIFITAYIH